MARPTEPGWYWLQSYGAWEIVLVGNRMTVYRMDTEGDFPLDQYGSDQWGSKITQEPAPDPPPPF